MELRHPPVTPARPAADRLTRLLLVVNLVLLLGLGIALAGGWLGGAGGDPRAARLAREVASKLKAAGALDEAAALYEAHLSAADPAAGNRANVAYSLGLTYLDRGQYEKALRWLYEAESLGAGGDVGEKIVHALESLGRVHAAQAALDSLVRFDPSPTADGDAAARPASDPVVARIGEREVVRSQVEALLDELPPEAAAQLTSPEQRGQLLRRYVADELLWRKARKLELDDDPEVRRTVETLTRQVVVARLIEREVAADIRVDEADLANYFAANRARYQPPPAADGAAPPEITLEQVRPAVERDYRMLKLQAGYQQIIDSELATADVELFPERMTDGR